MAAQIPVVGGVIADKYALESVLGEGGMGVVFSARHVLTGRRVAVKVLTRTGREATERVLAEAQTLARVEHPNVVSVLDVGEHEGAVYLVMELLRGQSLAEIAHGRALGVVEAVQHLMPALAGIAAAHAAGIIHRDLKPENLFVSMDQAGTGYDTKVLDFGVSKIADGTVARRSTSGGGASPGTPQYMAPEQIRAERDLDVRADIYALGVILYELLSGRLPFQSQSVTALAVEIVNDEPARLDTLVPQLDAAVVAIVHRAIAKRREDRFPDVASLATSLEPYSGGVRFAPPRRLPEHIARVSMQLEKVVTFTPRKTPRAITQDLVVKKRQRRDSRADPESERPPPPPDAAAPEAVLEVAIPKPARVPPSAPVPPSALAPPPPAAVTPAPAVLHAVAAPLLQAPPLFHAPPPLLPAPPRGGRAVWTLVAACCALSAIAGGAVIWASMPHGPPVALPRPPSRHVVAAREVQVPLHDPIATTIVTADAGTALPLQAALPAVPSPDHPHRHRHGEPGSAAAAIKAGPAASGVFRDPGF